MHPAAPATGELAVGDDGLIAATPPRGAPAIDLQGACVVPGLNDAHVHFPTWSLAQTQVRLEGAGSLDDALAAVAGTVDGIAPGAWLRGLGWRDAGWSEPPNRWALDRVTGDVPTA